MWNIALQIYNDMISFDTLEFFLQFSFKLNFKFKKFVFKEICFSVSVHEKHRLIAIQTEHNMSSFQYLGVFSSQ